MTATRLNAQETQLFNSSIADNIAYGAPPHTEEELREAAIAAQAHDPPALTTD